MGCSLLCVLWDRQARPGCRLGRVKRDVSCRQDPAVEVDLAEGLQPAGVVVPVGHGCWEARCCPRSCCPPWKIISIPGTDTRGPPCCHLPAGDEHLSLREPAGGAVLALGGMRAAARTVRGRDERQGCVRTLKPGFGDQRCPRSLPQLAHGPRVRRGARQDEIHYGIHHIYNPKLTP